MAYLPNPAIVLSTGTLLLLTTIIFGWVLAPNFIHNKIADQVKLTRGSEIWEKWTNVPIPIYFKLYLFNVTNPDEISAGALPNLTEVGPFTYREHREKTDIRETANGTIIYKEKITYYFEPELSGGLREDNVLTILNIPFVAMSMKTSELPYPLSYLASVYIARFKQKVFIKKTVGEILFKGWHVPMVAELTELTGQELMPNSTFGLFYGKNGTDDGDLEVDAGLTNVNNFGRILSWKGSKKLEWWKEGSTCNDIKGSDGSIFPPFVNRKRVIEIFNADLCRSLFLTYEKDVDFLGIPAYRFTAPKEMLEDPRTSELNRCFCSDEDVNNCLHAGAIDLAPCRQGAPVAMSTPHFLDGFEEYIQQSGLVPDREKHATMMDMEPTTGLVLRANKRIQINVQMKHVASVPSLSKLPTMLFPIIWADESASITDDLASQLKSQLLTPLFVLDVGKWILLCFSVLLIWIGIIVWISGCIRKKQNKNLSKEDSESESSMLQQGSTTSSNNSPGTVDKISVPLINPDSPSKSKF